ncbi:DUF1501 domain-containing protein [Lentisphaera profundi]|uniref:DUF1501 domain-containing protein n=1 Tax=Lentisphaera profundi TaxID=1658616 RepID=A0ABY7VPX6_9BACT|nr:DUF1501 domain-containing protein [Lentisphaera profundi]WDE95767.1 DUF1501 domain-containing protein [Lentisphaera profundi]
MSTNDINRRDFMKLTSMGVSASALSSFLNSAEAAEYVPKLHHKAKAKSVIFLYMSGGVSHVDSFDPKPLLTKMHGKPMPMKVKKTQFDHNGHILASPWKSKHYGKSGIEMTNLFPNIANMADDLAVVRSMTAKFSEHAEGNFFMHTGFPFLGNPSAGAWVSYGCGSQNKNLPSYVVLKSKNSGIPHGGVSIFGNGFLPAIHQGSIFNIRSGYQAVPNIKPWMQDKKQRKMLGLIKNLDQRFSKKIAYEEAIVSSVKNSQTAYAMQESVPELTDVSKESQATRDLYGVDDKNEHKSQYAKQCLMARRLVERGVRFVELNCCKTSKFGNDGAPWDQHSDLEFGHQKMADHVDQPIAALLQDLKQRGMLDETLVVFATEFGRTPFTQGATGRDHHPYGFSMWMAGGGTKGGTVYGATDELGYYASEKVSTVYDMWATILHQLGLNHERLTYRHSGRDMRLTDVHGEVWHDIL